jgi:hypothetical protein
MHRLEDDLARIEQLQCDFPDWWFARTDYPLPWSATRNLRRPALGLQGGCSRIDAVDPQMLRELVTAAAELDRRDEARQ